MGQRKYIIIVKNIKNTTVTKNNKILFIMNKNTYEDTKKTNLKEQQEHSRTEIRKDIPPLLSLEHADIDVRPHAEPPKVCTGLWTMTEDKREKIRGKNKRKTQE